MAITCADCNRPLTPQQAGLPCPQCGSMDRAMTPEDQAVLVEEKTRGAQDLAKKHYQTETGLTRIFRLRGKADVEVTLLEPIKLLEVNDWTVPSGIMPLRFGPVPDSGFHFPSIIVEITPEEFDKLKSQELTLPAGWVLGDLLPKASQNGAG